MEMKLNLQQYKPSQEIRTNSSRRVARHTKHNLSNNQHAL